MREAKAIWQAVCGFDFNPQICHGFKNRLRTNHGR